ncbi:hypothetical protein RE9425_03400 [Prescottella equi]|nr:hypothetical protein RE9425_03400 [Prescottella equi]
MAVHALKVTPDGTTERLQFASMIHSDLCAEIGCRYIDAVRLTDRIDMWIDDEGMNLLDPEPNRPATEIAKRFGYMCQDYYGVVVFTGSADEEGFTQSLDAETAEMIESIVREGVR